MYIVLGEWLIAGSGIRHDEEREENKGETTRSTAEENTKKKETLGLTSSEGWKKKFYACLEAVIPC